MLESLQCTSRAATCIKMELFCRGSVCLIQAFEIGHPGEAPEDAACPVSAGVSGRRLGDVLQQMR